MRLISIEQLQTGMALATDVQSRSGRLLAAAGTVVTKQHLIAFRTWGILEAEIVAGDDINEVLDAPAPPDQEQIDRAITSLLPHFRLNDVTHPLIAELLRLTAIRKATTHES